MSIEVEWFDTYVADMSKVSEVLSPESRTQGTLEIFDPGFFEPEKI